jgi:hypothetical protein
VDPARVPRAITLLFNAIRLALTELAFTELALTAFAEMEDPVRDE